MTSKIEAAAKEYREAYLAALAVRKPLEEEVEVKLKSVELAYKLREIRASLLKAQNKALNHGNGYPKRGLWRTAQSLQKQAEELERQVIKAREKESLDWTENQKCWSQAILLSNEAGRKAEALLDAALEE